MKLLLASLVVLTATSSAGTPTPPTPPGPPTGSPKVCKTEGPPLISLRKLSGTTESGRFVIWPSGAFSAYDEDDKGKLVNERSRCIDDADFTVVKDAIAKATWKFRQAEVRCAAVSPNHVEWTVKNKVVLDSHLCDGEIADETTQNAIEVVQRLEVKLTAITGAVGSGRGKP